MAEPDAPEAPETQEQRAIRAVQAIFAGGDLGAETLSLSNEFTDRQTSRLSGWLRRGKTGRMSYENPTPEDESAVTDNEGGTHRDPSDPGTNATGSQSTSAETYDIVDSGQSDDIENSLTGQGVSDRETTREADRSETDARNADDSAVIDQQ